MDPYEAKVFFTLLGCAVVLGLLIILFVASLYLHHQKNIALQRKNTEIEINTLEMERKRIASDMHDDLGPLLSAIQMRLNAMPISVHQIKHSVKIKALLDEAIQKLRETSYGLMPPILSMKGLNAAISSFSEAIEDAGKLRVKLTFEIESNAIDADKQVHLYRIFQEAIHNCIQHADANCFTLKVSYFEKRMHLLMYDDGIGFDMKTRTDCSGFGLRNILNRVELLEGEMYLDTKPGAGVKYEIFIPLK